MLYRSTSEQDTERFAADFAKRLRPGDAVALRGGLGAGKTAFVRGMALGLGLADSVSSPTFALVHEYGGGPVPLYHFDMYRVTDFESLYTTGFFDYLDGDGVSAVEWSERIAADLPPGHIAVTMTVTGENTRDILVEGDDRFEAAGP